MTPKAVRTLALSLPESHEEPHFERISFRVGKKIFATMTGDGLEAMVKVAPMEKVEALLATHPDVFFSYGGWTLRNGAIGVRVSRVSPPLMRELVVDAWKLVAPKRIFAAFEAKGPSRKKA